MKKFILLLIVPLLFFNSCEEEDENNCQTEPIQCGEIINIDVNPPDSGTAVVNSNGNIEIIGAHEGYSIITLRNCSTSKEGTYCTGVLFEYNLGDIYCPNYNAMSQWGEVVEYGINNGVITPLIYTRCHEIFENGNLVTFN